MPVFAAYPTLPSMDKTWGYTFKPLHAPARYWQYGSMDWTAAVSYAQNQFHLSPANVSINVSNDNAYNSCNIRISSNYWPDLGWIGNTSKPSSDTYAITLNSSKATSEDLKKSTATHEICHTFGLNDCESSTYMMYGYDDVVPMEITTYEHSLFSDRYGKY